MGMAASQGRLLMMTARLSNNEFEQQCVAYSKQRLADDSQKANDDYLSALSETQYQVISGYNGDTPTYEPVTYNQLTGLGNVATGKQYIVSDNKGQIVVSQTIANAFVQAAGDYNKFLKIIGKTPENGGKALTQVAATKVTQDDVHNAWDKYFASINRSDENGIYYQQGLTSEHVLGISFHNGKEETYNIKDTDLKGDDAVYCTYNTASFTGKAGQTIYLQQNADVDDNTFGQYYYNNYEIQAEPYTDSETGETGYRAYFVMSDDLMQDSGKIYLNKQVSVTYDKEEKKYQFSTDGGETKVDHLYVDQNYDENMDNYPITKQATQTAEPTSKDEQVIFYNGTNAEQRQLYDYAMAISEKFATNTSLTYDADKVQYYTNIYNQMTTKGYTTYQKMIGEKYINTQADEKTSFQNDEWLITLVKQGKLALSFYSTTEKAFIGTSLDDDESIVDKESKSKMAIAEQEYNTHMDKIEKEDKKFDMQLSKLDAEHTALQTEYESVAKVISKNVEKSFGTFNA